MGEKDRWMLSILIGDGDRGETMGGEDMLIRWIKNKMK